MRKRIISEEAPASSSPNQADYLPLEDLAVVEVSSEDPAFPVENAFKTAGSGWRAAASGKQVLRLVFDAPQKLHRLQLKFVETETARTQEFSVSYLAAGSDKPVELLRQQYNFSPPSTTEQKEEYAINRSDVQALQVEIKPEISGGDARASLAFLGLTKA